MAPSEGPNDWYQTIEFKESMFECFPPADSDLAKAATDVYTLTSEALTARLDRPEVTIRRTGETAGSR